MALALLLGNKALQNAVAEGDTRTISLHHIHTGEDLTVTYKRNGRYDDEALKKINHILRDWRRDEEIRMEPRLIDVVWEVYRDLGAKEPIQIICGYRAPATNAMLRRRSRGVAQFSQHTLGNAMDFYIPGVSLEAQREAGLRLQRGGVGYYPSSGSPFVHLDVGSVRHWPRMTHDQLARVFPNGRTVHVPSDGHPLQGYALAMADLEKRGSSPSQMSIAAARNAGVNVAEPPRRNLLASLFSSKDEEDDSEAAPVSNPAKVAALAPKPESKSEPKPEKIAEKPAEKAAEKRADSRPVPLPSVRPTIQIAAKITPEPAPKAKDVIAATTAPQAFSIASATSQPVRLAPPAPITETARASSANDVITSRGYWEGPVAEAPEPAPKDRVQFASAATRPAPPPRPRGELRPGAGEATGTVTPWSVKTADADDRVPHELALAYAAQADVPPVAPVTRALTMGAVMPRQAATLEQSGAATIARKSLPPVPATPVVAAARAPKAGMPFEDIWLRALMLAPDLHNYMTATLLGTTDPRELRPLMDKPSTVVMMTFSDNPVSGVPTDRFSGSAVVFVSTVTFAAATTGAPARRDVAFRNPGVFLTP